LILLGGLVGGVGGKSDAMVKGKTSRAHHRAFIEKY